MSESERIIIPASEEVGEHGVFYIPAPSDKTNKTSDITLQNFTANNSSSSYADAWNEVADIIKVERRGASLIKEELKETYRAFLDHKKTIIQLLEHEMERNE